MDLTYQALSLNIRKFLHLVSFFVVTRCMSPVPSKFCSNLSPLCKQMTITYQRFGLLFLSHRSLRTLPLAVAVCPLESNDTQWQHTGLVRLLLNTVRFWLLRCWQPLGDTRGDCRREDAYTEVKRNCWIQQKLGVGGLYKRGREGGGFPLVITQ